MVSLLNRFNKISNSQELLEVKPLPFLQIFIYLFLVCIYVFAGWAYYYKVEAVIKVPCVITSHENTDAPALVRSNISAKIDALSMIDGTRVKKDDVLGTITTEQPAKQSATTLFYTKFQQSIQDHKNYFSKTNTNEKPYFDQFEVYRKELNTYCTVTLGLTDLNIEKVISTINIKIINLNLLIKSLEDDINYINDQDSEEYKTFEEYQNSLDKFIIFGDNENNLAQKNNYKKDASAKLAQNSQALKSLTSKKELIKVYKKNYLSQIEKDITSMLNTKTTIETFSIKAPSDGILKVKKTFKKGEVLHVGTELFSIVKEEIPSTIQLLVPYIETQKLKKNQILSILLVDKAMPQGTKIPCKIKSIATEPTKDTKKNADYFKVDLEIVAGKSVRDLSTLKDDTVYKAIVITHSERLLNWFVKKFGIDS